MNVKHDSMQVMANAKYQRPEAHEDMSLNNLS